MAKKKIDLSGVKKLLFDKGERIALGICLLVTVCLVGLGMMKASGASKLPPWNVAFSKETKTLNEQANKIESKNPDGDKTTPPPTSDGWSKRILKFTAALWFSGGESANTKRINPMLVALSQNEDLVQLDYVRAGILINDIDTGKQKVKGFPGAKGGAGAKPANVMIPSRFVVVSSVFPMQEQLQEFASAFKMNMSKLMSSRENLPKPIGLDVYRHEKNADGSWGAKTALYEVDPESSGIKLRPDIQKFFQTIVVDDGLNAEQAGILYSEAGLATPLPKLANATYPALQVPGLTVNAAPPMVPADPKADPVKMPDAGTKKPFSLPLARETNDRITSISWPKELKDKYAGKFFVFDPTLKVPTKTPDKVGAPPAVTPPPVDGAPAPVVANAPPTSDVLIRFVDPTVEIGKTYRYEFRVRMNNPNYGRKDVSFTKLATIKDLPSTVFTTTKEITIPGEYHLYAADQPPDRDRKIANGADDKKAADDQVPVQIHKWIETVADQKQQSFLVADWAIAERMLVRRGDKIGPHSFKVDNKKGQQDTISGLMVEVPVWNAEGEGFELGSSLFATKGKASAGIPIEFQLANSPVLADFRRRTRLNNKNYPDEVAADLLILMGDGSLQARNSRDDVDVTKDGKERQDRVDLWLSHVSDVRGASASPMPGRGAFPGAPSK